MFFQPSLNVVRATNVKMPILLALEYIGVIHTV